MKSCSKGSQDIVNIRGAPILEGTRCTSREWWCCHDTHSSLSEKWCISYSGVTSMLDSIRMLFWTCEASKLQLVWAEIWPMRAGPSLVLLFWPGRMMLPVVNEYQAMQVCEILFRITSAWWCILFAFLMLLFFNQSPRWGLVSEVWPYIGRWCWPDICLRNCVSIHGDVNIKLHETLVI